MGMLRKKGWQPRRTILFCSWDGEEYGLIGSTEWVEEHTALLKNQGIVYINVDSAVQGNFSFKLKSAPQFLDPFFDATKKFNDPDEPDKNLFEAWSDKVKITRHSKSQYHPKVQHMGGASDFLEFYDFVGVPAVDVRYSFNEHDYKDADLPPVYHTKHNNIEWLKKFVDPDMKYHQIVAQVVTQLILSFSDCFLLPFNLIEYSTQTINRMKVIKKEINKHKNLSREVDLGVWEDAENDLRNATVEFHKKLETLNTSDALVVRMANDQMMHFDRAFVTFEQGEQTRNIFHLDKLKDFLGSIELGNRKRLEDLKKTITLYAYHLQMATQILQSPFIKPTTEKSTVYSKNKASNRKQSTV